MVDGSWDLNNIETTYSSTDGIIKNHGYSSDTQQLCSKSFAMVQKDMLKLERLNKNTFITVESRAKIRSVIYI